MRKRHRRPQSKIGNERAQKLLIVGLTRDVYQLHQLFCLRSDCKDAVKLANGSVPIIRLTGNLGYSHQVIVPEIEGIEIEVPDANHIVIKGMDKQKVGQFAADTRMKRPPEPYKGKGIRYQGEVVRIKEGKTGAK